MVLSAINTPSRRPSTPASEHDFSGRSFVHSFSGILSDMDGTLIDSTNAIVKHWEMIGKQYGMDPKTILATSHGRRSIDVFQDINPSRATWQYIRDLEGQIPLKYGTDATEIPGARQLLTALEAANARWAIITSGTRPLVAGWLGALDLAEPSVMVTAEDVYRGKPDPECYRLGKRKLGLKDKLLPVLVLEDAPAGIRAAKSAGCLVLALVTTHSVDQLVQAGADWIVRDLRSLTIETDDTKAGALVLRISDTLVL